MASRELLVNARAVSKTFGPEPLFENVSLTVHEGDRLGIIGPNGSGKSTLLQILGGKLEPDSGEVVIRKGTNLVCVPQNSEFDDQATARSVMQAALKRSPVSPDDWAAREAETLGRAGFTDFDVLASSLSGGWKKRLAIAEALVQDPAILLLDEPTNHLDLAGIAWLEQLLTSTSFASIIISHDRYFLENVPTSTAELNRVYPGEFFYVRGNYSDFLEKKAEFIHSQTKAQESLENRVRTEIEWLRRGPKARATKAKARIDKAQQMIGELAEMRSRVQTSTAGVDFVATGRKTKRLVHIEHGAFAFGDRTLFKDLNFTLTAGVRVGLVGANGSGKTTLLRLLRGEIELATGTLTRADALRIVYFDQKRQIDPTLTLKRALAPDSDSVVYRDRVIHVASWASRFLFTSDQLNQPVSKLSGGERARVLIANLMLEPADILLLDEPTNDLDIPTLEILEESLLEFPGAMVLVTHDRHLLDRVSTVVLGFDGKGQIDSFADFSQWDAWQSSTKAPVEKPKAAAPLKPQAQPKKLSYNDARDYETIEGRIAEAEALLESKRKDLEDPEVMRDAKRLEQTYNDMNAAQAHVDTLYTRWSELEAKVC